VSPGVDARRQQAALQSELKRTQKAVDDATARQASRDAAVSALVSQHQRQNALPQVLPPPQAILGSRPATPDASPSSAQSQTRQTIRNLSCSPRPI